MDFSHLDKDGNAVMVDGSGDPKHAQAGRLRWISHI